MGHFSAKIYVLHGSVLSGNQQPLANLTWMAPSIVVLKFQFGAEFQHRIRGAATRLTASVTVHTKPQLLTPRLIGIRSQHSCLLGVI